MSLPSLPVAPTAPRLPPEAERTSFPQQPQLKLVPSQTGIVLSWCVAETDRTCAPVDSYHLYAFHQDSSNSNAAQQHWKKIGEVKALPLPMACTLTQFQSGSTYHFAVRAKDIYGRFGAFCEPQCTNVINSSSSWTVKEWKYIFLHLSVQKFHCSFFLLGTPIIICSTLTCVCKYVCLTTGHLTGPLSWRSDASNDWLCLVNVCNVYFVD